MNRAASTCFVILICALIGVGCHNPKTKTGYDTCELESMSALTYRLQLSEFGTRLGDDGKPTTDPNPGNRMVVHVLAGESAYHALLFSTFDASDPVNKFQAQYVGGNTQMLYPFLNTTDGSVIVTGEKPAGQTEHVAAGSESTTFIMEVDHNGDLTNKTKWIHRVYVTEAKDHVCVWAQEGYNGPKPAHATKVKQGEFVEATYKDGRWKLSQPQAFGPIVPRQSFVVAALARLVPAGFPP